MKALRILAEIIEAFSSATVNISTGYCPMTENGGSVTYGDVVKAIMNSDTNGYWKSEMLDLIPRRADSASYAAAIAIIEDNDCNAFWKHDALEKVFGRS